MTDNLIKKSTGFFTAGQDPGGKPKFIEKVRSFFSHDFEEPETIPLPVKRWQPVIDDPDERLGEAVKRRARDIRMITIHGEDPEVHKLAEEIRKRREKLPKSRWFRCTNPTCAQVHQTPGDSGFAGQPCALCNARRSVKGGVWKEMSQAEIADHKARQAAAWKAIIDREKEEAKMAAIAQKVIDAQRQGPRF